MLRLQRLASALSQLGSVDAAAAVCRCRVFGELSQRLYRRRRGGSRCCSGFEERAALGDGDLVLGLAGRPLVAGLCFVLFILQLKQNMSIRIYIVGFPNV